MATYSATSCPITTDNAGSTGYVTACYGNISANKFGGLSAVWGGSLRYQTTHLSRAYINLSSLLPYTINPSCVTHVRVDVKYGNYYCDRSYTVCASAHLGVGQSRTSDVVKLGYSNNTTPPSVWYINDDITNESSTQTDYLDLYTGDLSSTYLHIELSGTTPNSMFFGEYVSISSVTITYTDDPEVNGSAVTNQLWPAPDNTVTLKRATYPMDEYTLSGEWIISKYDGELIDTLGYYNGFEVTCSYLTTPGVYLITSNILTSAGTTILSKDVTVTISPLSEDKYLDSTQLTTQTEITDGRGESKIYTLFYRTTYESAASLSILVNGVTQSLTTSDVWKYTVVTITSNGTYTLTFNATNIYDSSDTYTSSYDLVVDGILQGTGTLNINGQPITNSNGRVPAYSTMNLSVSGISGWDSNATHTWSVVSSPTNDPSYYELTDTSITTCTLKPKNTSQVYYITHSITSYGVTKSTTLSAGVSISCYKGVVATFTVAPNEGGTTTHFITSNESIAPVEDPLPQPTKTYLWQILDSNGIVYTDCVFYNSTTYTSENIEISFPSPDTYTIRLIASSDSYEDGVYELGVLVGNAIQVDLGVVNRYSIELSNGEVIGIAARKSPVKFTGLTYMKSLNQTGSATFRLIGANKFTKEVGGIVVSATSDLLRVGTKVTILDNLVPLWMGVISGCTEVNQNFFSNVNTLRTFDVECDESIKELSFEYVPLANTGTVNGTIPEIVGKIIDSSNIGVVTASPVNYAISIETTSRLAALDSLSNQLGWRYRCRPNITSYYKEVSVTTNEYSEITSYRLPANSGAAEDDKIVLYDPVGKSYAVAFIDSISTVGDYDIITFRSYYGSVDYLRSDGGVLTNDIRATTYNTYLIDYKPTYYQSYIPISFKINQYAQNVTDLSNAKDKYGEVSVYGVGYSGEHIASNMRAWMVVNPDYTIDKSARIATSYDSSLDSISKIDTVVGKETSSKSFARYNLVLNGWSFPTTINANYVPTVFYSNLYKTGGADYRHLRKIELTYDSSECPNIDVNPRFFYDQNNNKKTSYTISVDLEAVDLDGVNLSNVISSFIPMTNVIFNRVILDTQNGVPGTFWMPTVGKNIRIGDSHAVVVDANPSGSDLIFDWDIDSITKTNDPGVTWDDTDVATPHGHLTDVLVMDDSMTVITEGNYDNPVPNSPKYNYPTINQTILGPEGYSLMELERLACRYMQYGSNYTDRGSCKIPLPAFTRPDYEMEGYRIPMVGDRIAFLKSAVNNASGDEDYTTQNYELQSYKVDTDKMICEVKYGMPMVLLGDVLYNMLSNSGMSILPTDSEDNV